MATLLRSLAITVGMWAIPLITTLAVELPVAAAFPVGRRHLGPVALVSVVTNPLLNLVMLLVYSSSWGDDVLYERFVELFASDITATTDLYVLVVLAILEIVVIVVEWRLLMWVLHVAKRNGRGLLAMSAAMNAASALVGIFVVDRYWPL